MESGNYERRLQVGLPTISNYSDASFISSSQPEYHMQSMVGYPRAQPDQQQLSPSPASHPTFSYSAHLSHSHSMAGWNCSTTQPPLGENSYGYGGQNIYQEPCFQSTHSLTPRYCPQSYELFNDSMRSSSHDGPSYILDSARDELQTPGLVYEHVDNIPDFALNRMSMSPHPTVEHDNNGPGPYPTHTLGNARFPRSESSDEGGLCSREMTAVEVEETGTDEPYAKLIWRALMSAPDHSMVLQEIYQWFREHTSKGASDSKGWMNSIRHNLSMNAAFKKTERKTNGDETKKSTEWVLEEFAIKEGVQSTTRYRKGNSNKKYHKTSTPAPSRQISGSKGGNATRDNSYHLKRQRGSDRFDHRDYHRRAMVDNRSMSQYHDALVLQRQISPLTPNPEVVHSPYLFKTENFDPVLSDETPLYQGLENVQGVYMDHDAPLFSTEHDSQFHDPHLMYNRC